MNKPMSPGEKALILSYVHCELLKTNLSTTIHEQKVAGNKNYKSLKVKLEKLRQAAYEAFKEINAHLKASDEFEKLYEDIDKVLEKTWIDEH